MTAICSSRLIFTLWCFPLELTSHSSRHCFALHRDSFDSLFICWAANFATLFSDHILEIDFDNLKLYREPSILNYCHTQHDLRNDLVITSCFIWDPFRNTSLIKIKQTLLMHVTLLEITSTEKYWRARAEKWKSIRSPVASFCTSRSFVKVDTTELGLLASPLETFHAIITYDDYTTFEL